MGPSAQDVRRRSSELLQRAAELVNRDPAAAEALVDEAAALSETLPDAPTRLLAGIAQIRGLCRHARGDFEGSIRSYARAAALLGELGPDFSLRRGQVLAYQADDHRALGQVDESVRVGKAAVEDLVLAWKRGVPDTLAAVSNVSTGLRKIRFELESSLYRQLLESAPDDDAAAKVAALAEEPFSRWVSRVDQHFGPSSLLGARAREDLAKAHFRMGDCERAESLQAQAAAARLKYLPEEVNGYASSVANLGRYRDLLGRFAEAEGDYDKALEAYEHMGLPEGDERVLTVLMNRAGLFLEWGRLGDAERWLTALERLLTNAESASGWVAHVRTKLAETRLAQMRPIEAEGLLQSALELLNALVDESSSATASTLRLLSVACGRQARLGEAFAYLVRARACLPATDARARLTCDVLEADLQAASGNVEAAITALLASVDPLREAFGVNHPRVSSALESVAGYYALLKRWRPCIDALRKAHKASLIHLDDVLGAGNRSHARDVLTAARRQSSLFLWALEQEPQRTQEDVQEGYDLVLARKGLETRTITLQKTSRAPGKVTLELAFSKWDLVLDSLGDRAALVEYVRVTAPRVGLSSMAIGRDHYVAFVMRRGAAQPLAMVPLGDAEDLDRGVRELWTVLAVAQPRKIAGEAEWRRKARRVSRLVWEPITAQLGDVKRVHIAPDAELWRLPFEVLPDGPERLLMDEHVLSYLLVGRELWRLRNEVWSEIAPGVPLVLAAPDFGPPRASGVAAFSPCPEMEPEGLLVADKLKVEAQVGPAATEAVLRNTRPPPEIIHIATHGFYLRDEAATRMDGAGSDSLERCGLALAGANGSTMTPSTGAGSGVLLASTIVDMDLRVTDLVCLSACETGLGDIRVGDAVQGLRAAFRAAGCHSVICTLWRVPDASASALMTTLYDSLLARESRAGALQIARDALRKQYPDDPFHWAGFVLEGESEPLHRFEEVRQIRIVSLNMRKAELETLQEPLPPDLSAKERAQRLLDRARRYWTLREANTAIVMTNLALSSGGVPVELRHTIQYERAGFLRQAGDWKSAIAEYDLLLRGKRVSRELRGSAAGDQGTAFFLCGEHRKALKAFARALRNTTAPNKIAHILINSAAAHVGLGNDAAARKALTRAIATKVDGPIAYEMRMSRGECLLSLGSPRRAAQDFELAVTLAERGHGDRDAAVARRAVAEEILRKSRRAPSPRAARAEIRQDP